MATVGNVGGYVARILGLAKEATNRLDAGLYLMAAAMVAGALLAAYYFRRNSIEEADVTPLPRTA